jgi:hypothetical protein
VEKKCADQDAHAEEKSRLTGEAPRAWEDVAEGCRHGHGGR